MPESTSLLYPPQPVAARKPPTLVVLGGNAFARPGEPLTMAGQFDFARRALEPLGDLLAGDTPLLLTHGNGPQVGHMLVRVEAALGRAYTIPLEVCVAESEGELGYVLQQTLYNLLAERGSARPIAALLTQVVVSPDDPAFREPTKPIGQFYSAVQARELQRQGFAVREDAGRGWRRVVASPWPTEIVELPVIERLLEWGAIVIAGGGGGIPVVRRSGCLTGVEAVVDKDLAAALLGRALGAELLLILTGVPCAYLDFGSPRQTPLGRIGLERARQLIAQGHFAPGSMLPKMQAAVQFADRPGTRSIVCDPASLVAALKGRAGTIVCDAADV